MHTGPGPSIIRKPPSSRPHLEQVQSLRGSITTRSGGRLNRSRRYAHLAERRHPRRGREYVSWTVVDRQRFWAVLDVARTSGADNAGHARALVESLSRESPEDIESFARIQAELMNESYAWPLWGAAYVINGGCSDDGFDYFRGWLLIQGREVWERALADPDSLVRAVPEGGAVECEDVLYAAAQAFERVVGRPLGFATGASAGEPTGAKWSEDDLPALFPQLGAVRRSGGAGLRGRRREPRREQHEGGFFVPAARTL